MGAPGPRSCCRTWNAAGWPTRWCPVRTPARSAAAAPLLRRGAGGRPPARAKACSARSREALAQWSEDNIRLCAARQREILHAAAETVRPGGRLIYSTCTFAPEENECMAAWFVRTHPDFCLEETGAGFGMPGLPWERVAPFAPETDGAGVPLERCRRIFPAHGGEGHFVAKFRRKEAGAYSLPRPYLYAKPDTNSIAAAELYKECFFSTPTGAFVCFGDQVRLLPEGLPELKGGRPAGGRGGGDRLQEPGGALSRAVHGDETGGLPPLHLPGTGGSPADGLPAGRGNRSAGRTRLDGRGGGRRGDGLR